MFQVLLYAIQSYKLILFPSVKARMKAIAYTNNRFTNLKNAFNFIKLFDSMKYIFSNNKINCAFDLTDVFILFLIKRTIFFLLNVGKFSVTL